MGLDEMAVAEQSGSGVTPTPPQQLPAYKESIFHFTLHVKPTWVPTEQETKVEMRLSIVDSLTASKLVILEELLQESRERTKQFQNYHSVAIQKNEDLMKALEFCNSQLQICMNQVEDITSRINPIIAEKRRLEVEVEGFKNENEELKEELSAWKTSVNRMCDGIVSKLSPENFPV